MANKKSPVLKQKIYLCLKKKPQRIQEIAEKVNRSYPCVRDYLLDLLDEGKIKSTEEYKVKVYYK